MSLSQRTGSEVLPTRPCDDWDLTDEGCPRCPRSVASALARGPPNTVLVHHCTLAPWTPAMLGRPDHIGTVEPNCGLADLARSPPTDSAPSCGWCFATSAGRTAGIQPRRFGEGPLTQQHNRFGLLRPCRSCSSLKHMERIAGFYPSFDSSRETAKDFSSCAATLAVQAPRPPLSNSVIIRPPPARLQFSQHISCRPLHAPPPPLLLLLRSLACVSDDGH